MSVLPQKSSTVLIILHSVLQISRAFLSTYVRFRNLERISPEGFRRSLKPPQAPFQCPFGAAAPGGFGSQKATNMAKPTEFYHLAEQELRNADNPFPLRTPDNL
jgi:hypothetical protein